MTRCAIGIFKNNQVRAVYLNGDGYPDYTGQLLLENYTDTDTVEGLIELGDLSQLTDSLDTTMAYHRDYGEPYRTPNQFRTPKAYLKHWNLFDASYLYLFNTEQGLWLYADIKRRDKQFSPLQADEAEGGFKMDAYRKMSFTGITISGFRGYQKATSFSFGKVTLISGGNRKGKSSIGEAIAYAITGYTMEGGRNLDDLYNEQNPSIDIRLSYVADGCEHLLTRQRKDDLTDITLDGKKATQKQLDYLFGEHNSFLAMFNPSYFIETLGSEGRNLMRQQLPAISQETVLAALSPYSQKLLGGLEILSTETCAEKLKHEIGLLEESQAKKTGQKEEVLARRRELSLEQKLLSQQQADYSKELVPYKEKAKIKMAELQPAYQMLLDQLVILRCFLSGSPPDTADLTRVIQDAEAAMPEFQAMTYQSKYSGDIAQMCQKLEQAQKLREYYSTLARQMQPGWTCPTCFAAVTIENLSETKSKFAAASEQLNPAILRFQELLALTGSTENNEKEKFEKEKEKKLRTLHSIREGAEQKRSEILESHRQEISELEEWAELHLDDLYGIFRQMQCRGLNQEECAEVQRLSGGLKTLSEKASALQAVYVNDPIPRLEQELADEAKKISMLKEQLGAVLDYAVVETGLQFEQLKTEKVSISLMKVVKTTGEVKPAFDFLYMGRNYRKLSRSEKYFAGLEVAGLLRILTQKDYPVFLDNVESYETIGSPSGQVFISRVVNGAALSVVPAVPFDAVPELPKAS